MQPAIQLLATILSFKIGKYELVSTSAYPKHKHATNEKKINVLLKYVPASAGLLEARVLHEQGLLRLSLYFIIALTAQIVPFPAYKPAFRPGLFAFSAFVSKHNSLARETKKAKKDAFPKLTKKCFSRFVGHPLQNLFPPFEI